MKATLHMGKQKASKHNDRNFDTENIGHIDTERSAENRYINFIAGYADRTFEEMELEYYKNNYSEELNRINENYRKRRKYKQMKKMEDWLKNDPKRMPEEIILQVGNVKGTIDQNILMDCAKEFFRKVDKKYSSNFHMLDLALHMDEQTPHIHGRGVFDYEEDGTKKIGTDKALEQLGIERPDPTKKVSRYNNRMQTFTEELRKEWYEILEEHGIEINKNTIPTKHKDLEDYKRQQEEILQNGKEYKKAIEDIVQELDYDISKNIETEKDRIKIECAKAIRKGIVDICESRDLDINVYKEPIREYIQFEDR